MLTFILGGARSGKSELAERIAAESGSGVTVIATMEPGDDELKARVAAHRWRRPASWHTVEEARDVLRVASDAPVDHLLVLDCVTMWVSNLLLGDGEMDEVSPIVEQGRRSAMVTDAVGEFAKWAARSERQVVVVSNEVGLGIVPPYPLGRLFRDVHGNANRILASKAARVYYLVAGLALELRALGAAPLEEAAAQHHAGRLD